MLTFAILNRDTTSTHLKRNELALIAKVWDGAGELVVEQLVDLVVHLADDEAVDEARRNALVQPIGRRVSTTDKIPATTGLLEDLSGGVGLVAEDERLSGEGRVAGHIAKTTDAAEQVGFWLKSASSQRLAPRALAIEVVGANRGKCAILQSEEQDR